MGEEATALEKLGGALELAEPGGFVRNFVDLGPPMAGLLARLQCQREASHSAIAPYLAQILAAFPTPEQASPRPGERTSSETDSPRQSSGPALDRREGFSPPPASLVEPLTKREAEILTLMATVLSPQEMAGELFVSMVTIRTHIRNIYAKLEVHSRFEAVQRAKELGLL